jgi:hypothetical protein
MNNQTVKKSIAAFVGLAFSLALMFCWLHVAGANHSGWVLVLAFVGSFGLLGMLTTGYPVLGSVVGLALSVGSGYCWYLGQQHNHVGWMLVLAGFATLGTFTNLIALICQPATAEPARSANLGSDSEFESKFE